MRINWDKFWQIAQWVALAYLMVYLILKAVGVLHSPPPADIVAILGLGMLIGRHFQTQDHILKDVEILKTDVGSLKGKMGRIEHHFPDVFKA